MYQAKNYSHLIGTPGFSDQLLKNHFSLYQGYIKNANLIHDRFTELRANDRMDSLEYAELKRRSAWEHNGIRLHELYFENMTSKTSAESPESDSGSSLSETSPLRMKLTKQYGNFDVWEKDFRATGAIRGIGWAVLAYDKETDAFFNAWINEHDGGHRAGTTPLLIMDVFEHAFLLDYGIKRANYIEAFMKAIDWEVVEKRFA